MKEYEISYLSAPDLSEEARVEFNGAVESAIEKLGGNISSNSENVRRRLIYPIKKQGAGFLRVLQVSMPPEKVGELKEIMKKQPGMLRLTILQTAKRGDVSAAIFDQAAKQQAEPKKAEAAQPISDDEVAKKIEAALEEEVK